MILQHHNFIANELEKIAKKISGKAELEKQQKQLEEQLTKLVAADERFYRAIAYNCLLNDLEKLFVESFGEIFLYKRRR